MNNVQLLICADVICANAICIDGVSTDRASMSPVMDTEQS